MNRRQYLAGAATAGIGSVAGCLDLLLGEEMEFEASPGQVPDTVLDETGYEHLRTESQTVERTFEAGGESRDVTATNRHVEYGKRLSIDGLDLGDAHAARFMVLTTPEVSILGQSFNPVSHLSARELVRLQGGYDEMDSLDEDGQRQITIAGEETTRHTFTSTARIAGQSIDVRIHITDAVPLGDDLVVTIGIHPERLDREDGNLVTLAEAVEAE